MNKVKLAQHWLYKHQVKLWFLYLAVLFLPLSMRLNNYFLGLFIFVFIIEGAARIKFDNIKKNYKSIILIAIFFFIIGFGLFNSEFIHKALKQIERSIPLLVIPLIFLSEPKLYYKKSKLFFLSLTIGCLIAAFVCWGYLAYNLISKDEVYRIFTWEYSKLNLIKPLDMHAPYLAMFLFTSIGFLIATNQIKNGVLKRLKYPVILILMLFFFHLLSRTAIIYFMLSALVYLLFNKKYKTIIVFVVSVGLLFFMLLKNTEDKSNYFNRLFLEQTGINGLENVDGRFERWKYSVELFLEYPIFGAGTGDVDALRTVMFRENNDIIGFKNKFNAHNQFLELLSGQGLLGGAWFLLAFYFLIKNAYINKEYLYLYILSGIFFCCLTESMFRVSWGVVFFSILASLSLANSISLKKHL